MREVEQLRGRVYVMPCPEECEKSERVEGCAAILKAPRPDGSCWRCDGVGFIPHDGDPTTPKALLPLEEWIRP